MCSICGFIQCPIGCPNYIENKIKICDNCKVDIYEREKIWTDSEGNIFCCEECAKEYHGIKEMDD